MSARNELEPLDKDHWFDARITAREVHRIRAREAEYKKLKKFELFNSVASQILRDLYSHGQFYNDRISTYFFLNETKDVIILKSGDTNCEHLIFHYGILSVEPIYEFILKYLQINILRSGKQIELYEFSHYDPLSNVLYVHNLGKKVYRISISGIKIVDNGTDGVLFLSKYNYSPFELLPEPLGTPIFNKLILTPMNFEDGLLLPKESRRLFETWFYSLYFHELLPSRPILCLVGEAGSGKTFGLCKVGWLIFGSKFEVSELPSNQKDFDALLTNSRFVAIDNADSKIQWLNDRLAIAATGGSIKLRRLYTTNELIEYPIKTNIAITSRTPYFRREDVADRLLLLRLARYPDFNDPKVIQDEVLHNRDRIMTEVLYKLHEIVKSLGSQQGNNFKTKLRLASFANYALKISYSEGSGEEMDEILEKLTHEQDQFAVEGESVIELLEYWLEIEGNNGRELTVHELFPELTDIAREKGIPFKHVKGPRSLAQRLSNLKRSLGHDLTITKRTGTARKGLWIITREFKSSIKEDEKEQKSA